MLVALYVCFQSGLSRSLYLRWSSRAGSGSESSVVLLVKFANSSSLSFGQVYHSPNCDHCTVYLLSQVSKRVKKENYEHNYVIEFFYYLHKNKNNEKLIYQRINLVTKTARAQETTEFILSKCPKDARPRNDAIKTLIDWSDAMNAELFTVIAELHMQL